MVNPGAFQGSRKAFLLGERPGYSAGVRGGYAADALALIQRRYFKRYPVGLPHTSEPSPEFLANVDDDAPDVDIQEPDMEKMSEDEFKAAMDQLGERQRLVSYRKAQIKRWLAYQHMKDQDLDPTESGANNPYCLLLHKLTGTSSQRPRLKSAVNVWRKTARVEIDTIVKQKEGVPRAQMAKCRDLAAKELFAMLSAEEREQWAEQAKEEHEEALKVWKQEMEGELSTAPEDRQRCIQGLVRFAQPILDLIGEATGWKTTLIAGGPEPAHGGRLNVISVPSGTTTGDIKMNFGRAERARYKKFIVPIYGAFLQKCYTTEECRARALPVDEGFESLETMDLESSGADFDSIPQASKSITPDASASAKPPITHPSISSWRDATSELDSTHMAQRPARPGSVQGSRLNTPLPSPSRSQPNSPPISSTHSRPNTPPVSPVRHSPPISRNDTTSVTPPVPAVASRSKSAAGTKRSNKDASDVPSKEPRASKAKGTGARGGRTRASVPTRISPPPEPIVEGRRHLKRANQEPSNIPTKRARTMAKDVESPTPTSSGRRASKRIVDTSPRTSIGSPSGTTIQPEKNSPPWFSKTLIMLQSESTMGESWMELVRLWAVFEAQSRYEENGKLSASKRPLAVGEWIGRARSSTWRPVIHNLPQHVASFWEWWSKIQPEWRREDGNLVRERLVGDWEPLWRPGTNGIVSVMIAVFYWGLEVMENPDGRVGWLGAVEECVAAFRQL